MVWVCLSDADLRLASSFAPVVTAVSGWEWAVALHTSSVLGRDCTDCCLWN